MNWFHSGPSPATGRLSPALAATGIALLLGVAALCAMLWPEWRQNPDLSHGFFAPVIFGLLLWESRRLGPARWLRRQRGLLFVQGALLAVTLILFALAGLFAASVGWSHSLVLFLLAVCLAGLLAGGFVILADERVRLIPFNWIALTAIFLWILVAPLPTGTYARLTLTLQGWVTSGVMEVLQFFGVPARQHGNVIELARTTVGVEEACSGVRSLISCVYAGFFFAAWQVRRTGHRIVLIACAPVIALAMNFLRSLLLTLLANRGVHIEGAWHDVTGFAILGLTAAILAALAFRFETKEVGTATAPTAREPAAMPVAALRLFGLGGVLLSALAAFYYIHSRPGSQPSPAVPDLATLLPAAAPGWDVKTSDDLYQFAGILQTEHLFQRTYLQNGPGGASNLTVYVAYWPPGQTSVSRVASHTPDACWPGSGWIAQASMTERRATLPLDGITLATAEYRIFQTERGYEQHVWFWHVFDGHVIDYQDPYSLPALLQIAWKYGFRRQGSQYFIRVSSDRPWDQLAHEPLVREIFSRLKTTGL